MDIFKFELGDHVKDRMTGLSGIVVSRTQYLYGCIRYGVQPTKLKDDGTRHDWHYFDEPQLDLVETQAYKDVLPEKEEPPHGPRPDAPQR